MNTLLILGGTQFLGRAVAEEGVRRGLHVVVVHRGEHQPPPGVLAIKVDRTDPQAWQPVAGRLSETHWDVVVDTWSGHPAAVRRSVSSLRGRADRYVLVSSRSVYAWPAADGADEDAPLVEVPVEEPDELGYAESKRAAEITVEEAFGERALILRAGLLVGPGENTHRLPRWLSRAARGGAMPAPGPPELDWQYVDVRDLATWMLDAAAADLSGFFDAVGPPGGTTTEELLRLCFEVTGSAGTVHWRDPAAFDIAGVQPWTDLPGWFPPGLEHAAVHRAAAAKLRRHGLVQRPLRDTVADTWAWMHSVEGRAACRDLEPLMSPDVEQQLLDAKPMLGHARRGGTTV